MRVDAYTLMARARKKGEIRQTYIWLILELKERREFFTVWCSVEVQCARVCCCWRPVVEWITSFFVFYLIVTSEIESERLKMLRSLLCVWGQLRPV